MISVLEINKREERAINSRYPMLSERLLVNLGINQKVKDAQPLLRRKDKSPR
jgi:hypothetical protein